MRIVIPGDPIAKMRARHSRAKNFIRTYDPQSKEKNICKLKLKNAIKEALNGNDKDLVLDVSKISRAEDFDVSFYFYMEIPESNSIKEKNLKAWGVIPHNKKPDISNMIKFYEDCANEILFHDDSMISSGKYFKCYSNNPRTEIHIMAKKDFSMRDYCAVLSIFSPEEIEPLISSIYKLGNYTEERLHDMSEKEKNDYYTQVIQVFDNFVITYADKLQKLANLRRKEANEKIPMEGKTLC